MTAEHAHRHAEFVASLDEARASIGRGEGIPITQESMQALAEDVKRRGRERLAQQARVKAKLSAS